jgi:hypothetical protein
VVPPRREGHPRGAAAAITTVFYDNGAKIIDADIELNELDFTFVWLPSNVPPRGQTVMDSCYIAADPLTIVADLENTLTHEIGHFQGLDHTCWDHVSDQPCDSGTACTAGHTCSQRVGPPAQPNMAWAACTGTGCTCQPVDGAGQPVPDCADLSDPITVPTAQAMAIADATMYNFAPPRELRKRSPEADDIAGICATYPAASDPSSCMKPEAAGTCTCRLGRRAPPPLLALLLVTALSAIRIRARRG